MEQSAKPDLDEVIAEVSPIELQVGAILLIASFLGGAKGA